MIRSIFLLIALTTAITHAAPLDLKGTVTDETGKPAANATVYIYEASPRKGSNPMDASSYPDRGKLAATDESGGFTIAGLDENLLFKVIVAADDHPALVISKVDPAKPMKARLKPIDPARKEADHQLRGKVSDANGPVAGAEIEPFGMQNGTERWWGNARGMEAVTVSNAKGEFLLTSKDAGVSVDLRVSGKNFATVNYALLPVGDQVHELSVTPGATIKGKIVQQGQPVAGVVVGAVQADRSSEHFTGRKEAVTGADGVFTIPHMGANQDYVVYVTMKSLGERGSVPIQSVKTDGDEQTSELTEAEVQPAFTVSGRVRLSDNKPLPANVTLYLSRDQAWDSQTVKLEKDGKFKFAGVPANEAVNLSIRIKNYHLSHDNVSLDVLNPSMMTGLVDGDISDLDVLLEPGDPDYNNRASGDQQRLKATRLEGIPAGAAAAPAESK